MSRVKFSEDVRPVSDLKTRAAEVLDQVQRSRRPILLTRRGRGVAVMLDLQTFEQLVDRQEFVEAVAAGARAAAGGDLHGHAEALKILDSFGRSDA